MQGCPRVVSCRNTPPVAYSGALGEKATWCAAAVARKIPSGTTASREVGMTCCNAHVRSRRMRQARAGPLFHGRIGPASGSGGGEPADAALRAADDGEPSAVMRSRGFHRGITDSRPMGDGAQRLIVAHRPARPMFREGAACSGGSTDDRAAPEEKPLSHRHGFRQDDAAPSGASRWPSVAPGARGPTAHRHPPAPHDRRPVSISMSGRDPDPLGQQKRKGCRGVRRPTGALHMADRPPCLGF